MGCVILDKIICYSWQSGQSRESWTLLWQHPSFYQWYMAELWGWGSVMQDSVDKILRWHRKWIWQKDRAASAMSSCDVPKVLNRGRTGLLVCHAVSWCERDTVLPRWDDGTQRTQRKVCSHMPCSVVFFLQMLPWRTAGDGKINSVEDIALVAPCTV